MLNFELKTAFLTKIVNFRKFWAIWKLGNFRFLRSRDPGEWPIGFKLSVNLFYAYFNLLCKLGVDRGPETPQKNSLHFWVEKTKICNIFSKNDLFQNFVANLKVCNKYNIYLEFQGN